MRGLVVLVIACAPGLAHAAPARGFIPRCVPAAEQGRRCIKVTARDAAAIKRAILASTDPDRIKPLPRHSTARRLAERDDTEHTIGGYQVDRAVVSDGHHAVRLAPADPTTEPVRVTVWHAPRGWKVLDISGD